MRYILDDNGYIYSVSCNPIECNNKGCTGYTGSVPEGYDTIEIWATTANIRAYKIVDGNLVYDADKAAALEAEWNQCGSIASQLIKTAVYEMTELTLNGGNNHTITFSGVAIEGYTPIGIIQVDTSNNSITLQKFSLWSTNAYITIRNTTTSAQKFTTKITVLFIKN
jgi:uncharacterized protein Veg